jgi:hypothetical protein
MDLITAAQRRRGVGHPQATRRLPETIGVAYDLGIASTENTLTPVASTSTDALRRASIRVAGDIAP